MPVHVGTRGKSHGNYGTLPFVNYDHRSARCNVVKGSWIDTRDRSRRWQNDKRFDRGILAMVVARHAGVLMEMWIPGRRTNIQDHRPGPEELNVCVCVYMCDRAFRDREFFTRIIRLRQDLPIRYGGGRILFPSSDEHEPPRIFIQRTPGTGFPGSP